MSVPPDYPDERYSALWPAEPSPAVESALSGAQLHEVERVLRDALVAEEGNAPAFSKVSEGHLREAELLLRCAAFADQGMAVALRRSAALILKPYLKHAEPPEYPVSIGVV